MRNLGIGTKLLFSTGILAFGYLLFLGLVQWTGGTIRHHLRIASDSLFPAALDASSGGFLIGIDNPIGQAWRVGVAGGYSTSSFDASTVASSGSINGYDLAIYGGAHYGNFGLRLGAAYTWNDVSANRAVAFPGFGAQLTSGYSADTAQIYGEVGYDFHLGGTVIEPLADLYAGAGVDGVMVAGTTGESLLLTRPERERLAARFVDAAGGRFPVAVHAGAQSTADAVALASHAAEAGAAAVAAAAPPFFAFDQASLIAYFQALADACAPLPFYLYEIRQRTEVDWLRP